VEVNKGENTLKSADEDPKQGDLVVVKIKRGALKPGIFERGVVGFPRRYVERVDGYALARIVETNDEGIIVKILGNAYVQPESIDPFLEITNINIIGLADNLKDRTEKIEKSEIPEKLSKKPYEDLKSEYRLTKIVYPQNVEEAKPGDIIIIGKELAIVSEIEAKENAFARLLRKKRHAIYAEILTGINAGSFYFFYGNDEKPKKVMSRGEYEKRNKEKVG